MGKFVNYERLEGTHTPETLKGVFRKIIEEGWEIVYYHERIQDIDKMHVVIVCGIPNQMANL
jgi:hypothetical protein